MDALENFASTTIETAPSPANSGTDLYLVSGPPSPTAPLASTLFSRTSAAPGFINPKVLLKGFITTTVSAKGTIVSRVIE